MVKRFFTLVFAFILAGITSNISALNVDCTPGSLNTLVTDHSISDLSISGAMDARDFIFITSELTELKTLDISNATIEALQLAEPLFANYCNFAAHELPPYALFGCKALESVTLPSDLTAINESAFAGNAAIKKIELPESLLTIGDYAFTGCSALEKVRISPAVTRIGVRAFAGCESLIRARIFAPCTIERQAFAACPKLLEVYFGPDVVAIGEEAFMGTIIPDLYIHHCTKLKSIGEWAFACTPIHHAKLPAVESIGQGAFFACKNLKKITIDEGIIELPDYLMAENSALKDFEIPTTVEYIGTQAMAGTTSLTDINAQRLDPAELGAGVWDGINQQTVALHVADNDAALTYSAATQWQDFNITIEPYSSINDMKADKPKSNISISPSKDAILINADNKIATVRIFDTAGVQLFSTSPDSRSAQVHTAFLNAQVYLVEVVLTDGTRHVAKLSKP